MNLNAYNQPTLNIYLDADFTTMKAAAQAIELGINTALSEEDNQINGYQIELIKKNHRGNSRRSAKHLKQYIEDDSAIAVFGGLHSPPLLSNKAFINQHQILTLVPWAAAGPITRSDNSDNWIFRLSIDDSNAGKFIISQSLNQGFKRPYLLLENTGWGHSNLKKMSQMLQESNVKTIGVKRFNWGLNNSQARLLLHDIVAAKPDVVVFVGNAPEGIIFAKQLAALNPGIAMRSHWGITGGEFANQVTITERNIIDLQFIQTKFSFISSSQTKKSRQVFNMLKQISSISTPQDITATTGFIHAYDLTRVFISALKQIQLTENIASNRRLLHQALENLKEPVKGLIKSYDKPFSPYSSMKPNAHEALTDEDYRMGFYDDNNAVQLIELNNKLGN
tara:strand:+ start:263 stop:1441 length:1179 start_codon:yes stop_codon:yes gene_type:complete